MQPAPLKVGEEQRCAAGERERARSGRFSSFVAGRLTFARRAFVAPVRPDEPVRVSPEPHLHLHQGKIHFLMPSDQSNPDAGAAAAAHPCSRNATAQPNKISGRRSSLQKQSQQEGTRALSRQREERLLC